MERRSWLKAVVATIASWCWIGNRKTESVAAPLKEWDDLKDIRTLFKTKLPKDVHASIIYVSYVPDMPCRVCVYLESVTNHGIHKAAKISLDIRHFRELSEELRESSTAYAIRLAAVLAVDVVDGNVPYVAYIDRDGTVECAVSCSNKDIGIPYWIKQEKVMT